MAQAGGRRRSRPTSRCSRSRRTRSTPRCRAPATGSSTQILVQEGETVEVGTKLAVIGRRGRSPAPEAEAPPEPATQRGRSGGPGRLERREPRRRQPRARSGSADQPPSPLRRRQPAAAAPTQRRAGRQELRLAGRRADRGRARRRRRERPGHRPRRPRDEEGHPRLRRVRRDGCPSAGGSARARHRRLPSRHRSRTGSAGGSRSGSGRRGTAEAALRRRLRNRSPQAWASNSSR